MKFKGTIIGILTAILAVNIFTAYKLTTEAKRQTIYQEVQTRILLATAQKEFHPNNTYDYTYNEILYSRYEKAEDIFWNTLGTSPMWEEYEQQKEYEKYNIELEEP